MFVHARKLAGVLVVVFCSAAHGQSTAFTYQGGLRNGAAPANGLYDFRFRLWNSATNGSQIGATQCVDNVQVAGGVFTTVLDFGQQFASPDPRFLEIEVRPDTGLGCAAGTGFVVLAPRQPVSTVPLAAHAASAFSLDAADGSPVAAVLVDASGKVGVGTSAPAARLDVRSESGGVVHAESTAETGGVFCGRFITHCPTGRAVFASATNLTGVSYGVAGVSTSEEGIGVSGFAGITMGHNYGGYFESISFTGRGLIGYASAFGNVNYGVIGETESLAVGYGVLSNGRFAATGTKSFRIDHPDDPANKYLMHYCSESPEPINFYSGTAVLDDAGEAEVRLPDYFSRISREPRYALTAVGAAMPMLHVAREIDPVDLEAGAAAPPGEPTPVCTFRIAGGAAGKKVCWRVDAVRNDEWVRRYGAPVEVEKQGLERGTYQRPEFYGQPRERGTFYHPARDHSGEPAEGR